MNGTVRRLVAYRMTRKTLQGKSLAGGAGRAPRRDRYAGVVGCRDLRCLGSGYRRKGRSGTIGRYCCGNHLRHHGREIWHHSERGTIGRYCSGNPPLRHCDREIWHRGVQRIRLGVVPFWGLGHARGHLAKVGTLGWHYRNIIDDLRLLRAEGHLSALILLKESDLK